MTVAGYAGMLGTLAFVLGLVLLVARCNTGGGG
jgi:hypothetical protein